MEEYRLFFSWQNDRKDTKRIILDALETTRKALQGKGVKLFIDQDTRDRVGKRSIDAEVLEKIRKCDIFLADLTPVTTYVPPAERFDLPKHMPNSNVMYEYGYALHAKGEKRMIVLASLDKRENEHIEYMPFDINHDTITLFTDTNSLCDLHKWIYKIIEDVDSERASRIPQYAGALMFFTENGAADDATIRPKYRRIRYERKPQGGEHLSSNTSRATIEGGSPSRRINTSLAQLFEGPLASKAIVKPISKTTKLSYAPIKLLFINKGSEALDNLDISIMSSDSRVSFANTNIDEKWGVPLVRMPNDTFADGSCISQHAETLNPGAPLFFDEVFVHAPHDIGEFVLNWSFNSRTYQDSGQLTIHVMPEYKDLQVINNDMAGTESVEDLEINE